jgi:hypothetical protein
MTHPSSEPRHTRDTPHQLQLFKLRHEISIMYTPGKRAAAPSLSAVPLAVIATALMPAQCDMALIAFPIALE